MEMFMLKTGFYDKVTRLEAARLEETREEREAFLAQVKKAASGCTAQTGGCGVEVGSSDGLTSTPTPQHPTRTLLRSLPWASEACLAGRRGACVRTCMEAACVRTCMKATAAAHMLLLLDLPACAVTS